MSDAETRLETVFNQASEITDPEALSAFLAEACGGDLVLRRQVEKLLEAHRRAGQFLKGGSRVDVGEGEAGDLDVGDATGTPLRVGPYRLMDLIGEGGFSRVYLAEQEGPVRRWVALKVIKAGMDTREVILRFERERQVLALMDHPGIAKVFDAGATPGGRPYFAMEWVRGQEITRYCDEHRLGIAQRLELFRQVCLAVMHAHQKGVIHRDLKPSNVLVGDQDGEPCSRIIDFGIAKVTQDVIGGTAATWGASLIGTPAYMSPEQAQMGNPDIDTRSDIYSLGALLYELLTGHPPFGSQSLRGAALESLEAMMHRQDPPRPSSRWRGPDPAGLLAPALARRSTPHALCRALEGDLDWIVLKALEKEREARYQSASALAEDIRLHLDNRPVSAAAPSLGYRLRKLVVRNRHAVAVAALIALLLLGSVVVSSRLAVRARFSAQQARDSLSVAEQAESEATRHLIEVNVSAGLAANERGDHDHALLWFVHAALAADKHPRERALNLLRARMWLSWNTLPRAAFQVPAQIRALRFSPDGLQLLALAANHECVLWDVRAGGPLPWVREVGPVDAVAWSPDGSLVGLARAQGPVELRRVSDGGVLHRFTPGVPATALAFSPDGRYVAYGARQVVLWDLVRRDLVGQWSHPEAVSEILFSPRSRRMATACLDGSARVFDWDEASGGARIVGGPFAHRPLIRVDACANRTTYQEDFLSEAHASALAFLDQGRVLVTRSDLYEVSFLDIASGRLLQRFDRLCCSCNVRIDPEGGAMAGGMHGNVVGVWDTKTGQPRGNLLPQGGCVFDVAFSPRDEMIMASGADHTASFWSLGTGECIGPPLRHFTDVMGVAFAPGGGWAATAQADGLVRIWSVPSPGPRGHTLAYEFGPKRVRLGHQGRLVVVSKEPAWNQDLKQTRVYEVASGLPVGPELHFEDSIQDAAVSADGRHLAVLIPGRETAPMGLLQLHDVATGACVLTLSELPSPPVGLGWDPTAGRVALICRDGEVGVVRVEPEFGIRWLRHRGPVANRPRFQIRFSPDGRRLMSLGAGAVVEIWDTGEGGVSRREIPALGGKVWSFNLSRSGRYLSTTTVLGDVVVWDLDTGRPASPVLAHPGWVYRVAFSSDETRLVTACHDGQARAWDWRRGTILWDPLKHADQVLDAVFTPDDRWILTACRDGNVRVWDSHRGDLIMPAVKVGEQALRVVIPPDGLHAVIGSLGGSIHVLDLSPLAKAELLDLHDLRALGEVLSCAEIREGKRREFTAGEWLERFHRLQRTNPARLLQPPSADLPAGWARTVNPVPPCGVAVACEGCPENLVPRSAPAVSVRAAP